MIWTFIAIFPVKWFIYDGRNYGLFGQFGSKQTGYKWILFLYYELNRCTIFGLLIIGLKFNVRDNFDVYDSEKAIWKDFVKFSWESNDILK